LRGEDAERGLLLGIDVGGTKLEVALGSSEGAIVRQRQHWRFDVASKEWIVTPDMSVLHELVPGAPPAPHTHTSESAGFR